MFPRHPGSSCRLRCHRLDAALAYLLRAAGLVLLCALPAHAAYNVTIVASGASSNGAWSGASPDVWMPSASGSTVAVSDIETRLSTKGVVINTGGGGAENGDLIVSGIVSWSANTLTLSAARNIEINAAMNVSGTAGLALHYDLGAVALNNTSIETVRPWSTSLPPAAPAPSRAPTAASTTTPSSPAWVRRAASPPLTCKK